MSAIRFTLAMLATGGALTVADEAIAAKLVLNIPIATVAGDPASAIYLAGATGAPQYNYGTGDFYSPGDGGLLSSQLLVSEKADLGVMVGQSSTLGVVGLHGYQTGKSSDPTFYINQHNSSKDGIYYSPTVGTNALNQGADQYIYLLFCSDANATCGATSHDVYFGTAVVNPAGTLEYIQYAAIPEPASWALLVAGVGLAGGAIRRNRRQSQPEAMAQ